MDPLIAIAEKLGFEDKFAVASNPEAAMEIARQEYDRWQKLEGFKNESIKLEKYRTPAIATLSKN